MKHFDRLSKRVGRQLGLFTYVQSQQEPSGPFGSALTAWLGTGHGFRLIWDGKDQWFVLQHTDAATPEAWTDLAVTPRGATHAEAEAIVIQSLNQALAALHPDRPAFPLHVVWGDGTISIVHDVTDAETNLEWLDSTDPADDATVFDASGRPVDLVVCSLEVDVCRLS